MKILKLTNIEGDFESAVREAIHGEDSAFATEDQPFRAVARTFGGWACYEADEHYESLEPVNVRLTHRGLVFSEQEALKFLKRESVKGLRKVDFSK